MIVKWFIIGDIEEPSRVASLLSSDWIAGTPNGQWLTSQGIKTTWLLTTGKEGDPISSAWVVRLESKMDPELETFYRLKFGGAEI